ncbi:DUF1214 domain-containing protein [Corticibacterium sp. UT-5YL-CI-8]|nr:DUF1214 domain-containing protein [Tianweitania sp. UT-5YL-CI-8]
MLRNALLTLLALVIAIGGGAYLAWYTLEQQEGVGAVAMGQWVTFPDLGTADADPYTKARAARRGALALGRTEGTVFVAQHDDSGAPLLRQCAYTVAGATPAARFWTLFAADATFNPLRSENDRLSALHSLELLRQPDNTVAISLGAEAMPGNWLPVSGQGPLNLVLTLYDSPGAGTIEENSLPMPTIRKAGCDA